MFKILILDEHSGIRLGLKHLLWRYELVLGKCAGDGFAHMEEGVDLVLFNIARENGSYSNWEILKETAKRKKVIVIADNYSKELEKAVLGFGAIACIDKLDLYTLPRLIEAHLNKANTRIVSSEAVSSIMCHDT